MKKEKSTTQKKKTSQTLTEINSRQDVKVNET